MVKDEVMISASVKVFQILTFIVAMAVAFDEARADEVCAGILKRSLSAGQLLTSSDGERSVKHQLTSQSQQYLRLIEYALEKTVDHAERQILLQSIQVATLVPAPINVFAQLTSVQGVALNQAAMKMDIVRKLSADWKRVQEKLKEILSLHGAETSAREQTTRETNWVGVIDQAWKILLNGEVHSSPSWQQIGNEWYLAVGSFDFKMYVLKFDLSARDANQVLTIAGEYLIGDGIRSSPSWQQIGIDWYIAVGANDKKMYVLKFDSNVSDVVKALTVMDVHVTGKTVTSSPSWQQIGNEWYLAVGSFDGKIYVVKFDLSAREAYLVLTGVGEYDTGGSVSSSPSWQQIGNQWFLAVGASTERKVSVLKFDSTAKDFSKALIVTGEYLTGEWVDSSPSWQQIENEWYLTVGSNDKKIYVLKFNLNAGDSKRALTLAGEYLTGGNVLSRPRWQQIGNEWFLAAGSFDKKVYVLKFDFNTSDSKSALKLAGEYLTGGLVSSTPHWQQIESEWYLAIGSNDKKLYVLKFDSNASSVNGALAVTSEHLTGGLIYSSPRWQKIGNEWYLAVGSQDKSLHVLKFGKNLKRGSE